MSRKEDQNAAVDWRHLAGLDREPDCTQGYRLFDVGVHGHAEQIKAHHLHQQLVAGLEDSAPPDIKKGDGLELYYPPFSLAASARSDLKDDMES